MLTGRNCFCLVFRHRIGLFTFSKRWRVKQKWSAYRKPVTNSDRALKYFDSYYATVYGDDHWASMRLALLCPKSYCAMVNRFSADTMSTVLDLIEAGADLLPPKATSNDHFESEFETEQLEIEFGDSFDDMANDSFSADLPPKNQGLDSFIPSPPIVTPSHEKILSEQRLFYGEFTTSDDEFIVKTESWSGDLTQVFPPSLQIFAFPYLEVSRFPEPKSDPDGLFQYYLLDLASVFAVLALNPKSDDRILDMCAAPGGKSLAVMQSCRPQQLVCVDKSPSRSRRLEYTLRAFLPESVFEEVVDIFPGCDAISFADNHCASFTSSSYALPGFNKVLVDVPCLNDRLSLWNDDNNWFKPSRHKERLSLPEVQRDILIAALRCCAVDGIVVYSTCTLAPGQNDAVIFSALEKAAEEFGIEAVVEDPTPFRRFITDRRLLNIDPSWSRFGYLVAPILTANFGPAFCCRIRRTK